jgi:hypothetical protein
LATGNWLKIQGTVLQLALALFKEGFDARFGRLSLNRIQLPKRLVPGVGKRPRHTANLRRVRQVTTVGKLHNHARHVIARTSSHRLKTDFPCNL